MGGCYGWLLLVVVGSGCYEWLTAVVVGSGYLINSYSVSDVTPLQHKGLL